jgi:hypothetical protein
MDYLSAGQVIALRTDEGLVIDYLQSCMRETIFNATVTIGADRGSSSRPATRSLPRTSSTRSNAP